MKPRRKWPEHDYILKYYPLLGAKPIAAKLRRSEGTIRSYASDWGIPYGITDNRVNVNKVARLSGRHFDTVARAAKKDGVLQKNGGNAVTVPVAWAEKYEARYAKVPDGAVLIADGWLTIDQVGEQLNISREYIGRSYTPEGKSTLCKQIATIKRVEAEVGDRVRVLYNPFDVLRVQKSMREEARRARSMVAAKEVAQQCYPSLPKGSAYAEIRRRCPSYSLLLKGGYRSAYITHEEYEALRRERGLGPADQEAAD